MVGDGNHSLAAAKACWEAAKPTAPPNDARRYALVEVQNLHDPAVAFQPIHRVLFNVNVPDLLGELEKLWPHNPSESEREVIFLSPDGSETKLTTARDIMSVVEVSEVLDSFLRANKETRIDFVHGEQVARDEVCAIAPDQLRAELMTGVGWCVYASANFERLFLGCITTDFCNQIFIFQHFF